MTKDKDLEALFSTAITEFDDNEQFLSSLSESLGKIEYVKKLQNTQKRRYRLKLALTFAAGAASIILTLIIYPLLPFDAQILDLLASTGQSLVISGQAKIVSSSLFAILTATVLFCAGSITRDLLKLRSF